MRRPTAKRFNGYGLFSPRACICARSPSSGVYHDTSRSEKNPNMVAEANLAMTKAGKPGKFTLSAETRAIRGGLLLSDGAVEVSCALETLVRLQRGEISGEVAKALFD